jgi:DNA-binding winged helix-turn-helix (wHTH) protein
MVMHFGPFTLDSDRRQVFRDGTVAHLTPKAFELLTSLVTAAQRVVSKRELHDRLWPGTFVSDATLAGLVKELD